MRYQLLFCALFFAACGGGSSGDDDVAKPLEPRGLTPSTIDLTIDSTLLKDTVKVEDLFFLADSCSVKEGAVGGPGIRRVVSFSTAIINMGDRDLNVGTSLAPAPPLTEANFQFDECHQHDHFLNFVEYSIRGKDDNSIHTVGNKLGFYLADVQQYYVNEASASQYPTLEFGTGISSGWADVYSSFTPGQWVDVTGFPAGRYLLKVTVNPIGVITEDNDFYPNTAQLEVTLPNPNTPLPVTVFEPVIDPAFLPSLEEEHSLQEPVL